MKIPRIHFSADCVYTVPKCVDCCGTLFCRTLEEELLMIGIKPKKNERESKRSLSLVALPFFSAVILIIHVGAYLEINDCIEIMTM